MDVLQQLRDVHLPVSPGWWPPAPGWWVLALVIALMLTGLVMWWRRRSRRQRPFVLARVELARLAQARRSETLEPAGFADACSALIKRLQIHALGKPELATMDAEGWRAFLDSSLPQAAARQVAQDALGIGRFRPGFTVDTDALEGAVRVLISRLEATR